MIKQRVMSFSKLSDLVNRFNLYPDLRNSRTAEEIINKMRDDIRVEPVKRRGDRPPYRKTESATIAFTLSYDGKTPETVLLVADTLTSLFLSENQQVRERQTPRPPVSGMEMNRVKKELAALDNQNGRLQETTCMSFPSFSRQTSTARNGPNGILTASTYQIRTLKDRESFCKPSSPGCPSISATRTRGGLKS